MIGLYCLLTAMITIILTEKPVTIIQKEVIIKTVDDLKI